MSAETANIEAEVAAEAAESPVKKVAPVPSSNGDCNGAKAKEENGATESPTKKDDA